MTGRDSTSLALNADAEWGPILVVEDDPAFSRVLKKRLEMHQFEVILARDGEEGLSLAREKQPDLVISDWMMPRMDGLALCDAIRGDTNLQAIYFILLSHKADTDEKVQGLSAGADDYLSKNCDTDELIARVQAGMRIRALQRALIHQATRDGLTGLFNRTHFYQRVEDELRRGDRYEQELTLAMIDLDGLKAINDRLGHLAGDEAIRYAACMLADCCRATDVVARYGGDEFAVLFINANLEHARAVMERVAHDLERSPFRWDGRPEPFGMSYGLASERSNGRVHPDAFIHEADSKLYVMKRAHHETLSR